MGQVASARVFLVQRLGSVEIIPTVLFCRKTCSLVQTPENHVFRRVKLDHPFLTRGGRVGHRTVWSRVLDAFVANLCCGAFGLMSVRAVPFRKDEEQRYREKEQRERERNAIVERHHLIYLWVVAVLRAVLLSHMA